MAYLVILNTVDVEIFIGLFETLQKATEVAKYNILMTSGSVSINKIEMDKFYFTGPNSDDYVKLSEIGKKIKISESTDDIITLFKRHVTMSLPIVTCRLKRVII